MPVDSMRPPATYEDFIQTPGHMVAELIEGVLMLRPRPSLRNLNAKSVLGMELGARFHGIGGAGGPGGWWIMDEPELRIDDDVLIPDLAGWRHERVPELGDQRFVDVPPDWVCEVHSPTTGRTNSTQKLPIYARAQVRHLWLVDPIVRTLVVFRNTGTQWLLVPIDGARPFVRAEPFDSVEIHLERAWQHISNE